LIQNAGPIEHDADIIVSTLFGQRVHQKALAVGSNRILSARVAVSLADPSFKEVPGCAVSKGSGLDFDVHRGDSAVSTKIEQLLAVISPERLRSTVRRNLPLRARGRKGLNVEFFFA